MTTAPTGRISATATGIRPCVAQAVHRFGGGGAQRVTLTLARGLARTGTPALGIATRDLGEYAKDVRDEIELIELGATGGVRKLVRAVRRLRGLIHDHRVGLVHCHNRGSLMMALVARVGIRLQPRIWYTWHIPEPSIILHETGLKRRLLVWALSRCDIIWTDSQHIADLLAERAPVLHNKLRVFINAVPESEPCNDQAAERATLLWMARITPIKNPMMLLRAAAELRDEGLDFRIIMAGSGGPADDWYVKQINETHRQLGLEQIVEMPGWIDDVDALLARANVGVQTSLQEGLSLTLLEQMMAGLAPVATDCGDTAVAVRDGETGLLIPTEDETALVNALRKVIRDPAMRRRLGEQARAAAMERFSMNAMAKRVAEALPA